MVNGLPLSGSVSQLYLALARLEWERAQLARQSDSAGDEIEDIIHACGTLYDSGLELKSSLADWFESRFTLYLMTHRFSEWSWYRYCRLCLCIADSALYYSHVSIHKQ